MHSTYSDIAVCAASHTTVDFKRFGHCDVLIEEAHVATVGGSAFGTPECIRLSYAAADEILAEAARRIEKQW